MDVGDNVHWRLWHVSLLVFAFTLLATSCSCFKIPYNLDTMVIVVLASCIIAWLSMVLAYYAERLFEKIEKAGVRVNPRLVDDYVDGCVNNIILAFICVILGLLYVATMTEPLAVVVFSIFIAQVVVVLLVVTGLIVTIRLSRNLII